jgi:hypothetical protein
MAKNKISEYSSTASNNTDIAGINIAEGCAPSGINNAIRELMAQIKDMQTGADADGFVVGGAFTSSGGAVFSSGTTFSGAVVMSSTVSMNGNNNIGSTTSATLLSGTLTQTTSSKLYLDDSITTATAPPLSWESDTNTGFYRPAADTVALVTNGADRLRINSSGNVIIGVGEGTTTVTGNILRSPSGAGTNISGSNLEIQAGNGTGTGGSGLIILKTSAASTTSSSTANTLTQRLAITKTGAFSFGTTATDYGTDGQVLMSNGNALPTWQNLITYTGTAPLYGVRAWACFDGSAGASPVIKASGNIASIVRNSTGNYTITFTTAMTSVNYAVSLCGFNTNATGVLIGHVMDTNTTNVVVQFNVISGAVTDSGGYTGITIVM